MAFCAASFAPASSSLSPSLLVDGEVDDLAEHPLDELAQALVPQDLLALAVDELALLVHHLVVLEQVLADLEVALLDLLLRALDRLRDPAVLDRLAVLAARASGAGP